MSAYLVIREGNKWSDVFRLIPGRTVTIGRANTNQIVIKDEQASRQHAEVFLTQGRWTLRDLDSRNGTRIGERSVRGDYPLTAGEVIRIAHTQLAFVFDLTKAFAENAAPAAGDTIEAGADASNSSVLDTTDHFETTTITHRRGQTRYLTPAEEEEATTVGKGLSAARLCRLAFALAGQATVEQVAELALRGLLEHVGADAGGVLLAPPREEIVAPPELKLVAQRSDSYPTYHRVSNFLAGTVLREGEAVLARNIAGDSRLGSRDSKGEILATSVICAPIRADRRVLGLIHLYCTGAEKQLDPEALEFTLAVADNVALAIQHLQRQQELADNLSVSQNELAQLRKRLGVESEIVGGSAAMARVHEDIGKAAPSRATVLIRGESGVGKELVARAVHFSSPRKKGPFVCLNCAALTETLLESELFGHERGAFTGATERKLGKFEAAHQGTLLLDEIGEMSHAIQAKFLRVLEGHPFERVGGHQPIRVDTRVIAATNRDLELAVKEGQFRRDLYFRLRVVEILVPPLRERPEDVLALAHHFLRQFTTETGRKLRGYSAAALAAIRSYGWPGNVRELRNVIERAVLLARSTVIEVDDLALSHLGVPTSAVTPPPCAEFEPVSLDEIERRHILATLNATGWNKSRSAAILGIERSTLDRKIRRHTLGPGGDEGGQE